MFEITKTTTDTAEINAITILPQQGKVYVQMGVFSADATEPHTLLPQEELPADEAAWYLADAKDRAEATLKAEVALARSEEADDADDEATAKAKAKRAEFAAKLEGFTAIEKGGR
jgi:hypothetical protein